MSISMQFDNSKLDTQPGEALGKIGSAVGTLKGRTASAGSVKREMKGAIGENRATTDAANKQAARDSEIDHMVRKETIRAAVKHGAKIAATESTNRVNVSAFKAKETAKRSTMRTAATSKVRVEAAKQKTKSTPIAKAAPAAPKAPAARASKPSTPRKPASPLIHTDAKGKVTGYTHRSPATMGNTSAPKPTTASKPRKA